MCVYLPGNIQEHKEVFYVYEEPLRKLKICHCWDLRRLVVAVTDEACDGWYGVATEV